MFPRVRRLRLTTPATEGPDVRALQRAVNVRRSARGLSRIAEDGEYGPATDHAVQQTAFLMGIGQGRGESASPYVQRLLTTPSLRNPVQLVRAASRLRRHRRARRGAQLALAFAEQWIGHTERPAGSNRSHLIDAWGKPFGSPQKHGLGWPWCGVFAGACLRAAGLQPPRGIVYTPQILAWARTGTGGFERLVPWSQAQPGDLALYKWTGSRAPVDHVGLVVKRLDDALVTIEGNTSPDDGGSQNNGGGVYRRHRRANVIGCARPRWG